MEPSKPKVAVVGVFQNGKSTLVNCLLDGFVAPTGIGLPTTHLPTTYSYGEFNSAVLTRPDGSAKRIRLEEFFEYYQQGRLGEFAAATVTCWRPILRDIDLIDTPGFDADNSDTARALAGIDAADLAVFVCTNKGLGDVERCALQKIDGAGKPHCVVVNCNDWQQPDPGGELNGKILSEILGEYSRKEWKPIDIWPCNLAWFWEASGHLDREIRLRKSHTNANEANLIENAEGLREGIMRYWGKRGGVLDPAERIERSRFLDVRRGVQECRWKSLTITGPAVRRTVSESLEIWSRQLRDGIESAKTVIAK
jgi:hypothetical protein